MGTLIVRNVDDGLIDTLKRNAERNGRSMEGEHRELLREALAGRSREALKAEFARLRAATSGVPQTRAEDLLRAIRDEE